jgi:hypothetical protein
VVSGRVWHRHGGSCGKLMDTQQQQQQQQMWWMGCSICLCMLWQRCWRGKGAELSPTHDDVATNSNVVHVSCCLLTRRGS